MEISQGPIKTADEEKPVWFGGAGNDVANEYAAFYFCLENSRLSLQRVAHTLETVEYTFSLCYPDSVHTPLIVILDSC
jgi:hypothetical protein